MKNNRIEVLKYWDKVKLKDVLISNLDIAKSINNIDYNEHFKIKMLLLEAVDSNKWNALKDYNGCTLVQDDSQPSIACFIHDYCWISGMGGKIADNVFYNVMLSTGVKRAKAKRRFIGVRIGWALYFKWKYVFNGKQRAESDNLLRLNSYYQK